VIRVSDLKSPNRGKITFFTANRISDTEEQPMAYDEQLASRVRKLLKRRKNFSERKMFGGICFMLGGNMCCGVTTSDLMLRLGPEAASAALMEPCTREMDFTGRPMKGMIYVEPEGYETEADLKKWVQRAVRFAGSLPAK